MTDVFAFILNVLREAWAFFVWCSPFKWHVVRAGGLGSRFTFGKPGVDLPPGWHFGTFGQAMESYHAALNYTVLDELDLEFSDGVPARIRGVVTFTVRDMGKFLTESEQSDELVGENAEAALCETLLSLSYKDFCKDRQKAQDTVRAVAQKQCGPLGVLIRRVRIQRCVVTHPTIRAALASAGLVKEAKAAGDLIGNEAAVALLCGAQAVVPLVGDEEE